MSRELKAGELSAVAAVWEGLRLARNQPAMLQQAAGLERFVESMLTSITQDLSFGHRVVEYLRAYPEMDFKLAVGVVWQRGIEARI